MTITFFPSKNFGGKKNLLESFYTRVIKFKLNKYFNTKMKTIVASWKLWTSMITLTSIICIAQVFKVISKCSLEPLIKRSLSTSKPFRCLQCSSYLIQIILCLSILQVPGSHFGHLQSNVEALNGQLIQQFWWCILFDCLDFIWVPASMPQQDLSLWQFWILPQVTRTLLGN